MSCLICTNRRKDHGTENFGGFVYVLDGFPQHVFVLRVFVCPTNITLFCLYFVSIFPATTPRANTHHLYRTGYHACVYIPVITPELSRSTIHVHRVITPAISNSYFVVYLSHFTPPLLLLLHHHRAPHATTYSTNRTHL